MSLLSKAESRKSNDGSGYQLYDLLIALGFRARERVSINTQLRGGPFVSELHEVHDLAGWTAPQDRNVWWGVNPVGRHVRYGRGGEADITRVRTLFADLDVKPGKNLDTLDQCYTAARTIKDYLGVWPVALIESGHGLQPLWRVGSPPGDSNVIDRDRSRDECREICWRFGAIAQEAARSAMSLEHRTIDGVFNLDRILRCPGSVNWKNPDDPVPVRTAVYPTAGRILLRNLVARLDRDGIQPLARIAPTLIALPTSFGEADQWINEQPGATLDVAEMHELPRSRVLWQYLDAGELVRIIGEGDEAHATMRDKVMYAVYAAQEGRAGLVLALHNIGDAYLSVMEARARGELPGEARDAVTATREWANAVRGAVARARGRRMPDIKAWADRVFANDDDEHAADYTGRQYWPAYRPAYQLRYRKRWWE
jgi:hypothetical protein